MLGATIWLAVAITLVASVLVETAASFARAGLHAAADRALEPALNDALADYQNALQSAIAQDPAFTGYAGNDGYPLASLPRPLARTFSRDASADGTVPALTLAYSVVPTTVASPSCAPPSGTVTSAGDDAIAWLQCHDAVRESRASLHVTVRVLDAGGIDVLAQREEYVTLRLFAEPPYSAVAGRRDGAAALDPGSSTPAAPAHEGDIGGGTVSGTGAVSVPGVWPAGGTVIHVRYECRDGAGRCANAAPPDPDDALRADARWSNGNSVPD